MANQAKKETYTTREIADILGFSDYHKVSNYLAKVKASPVDKIGNVNYYPTQVKDMAITYFKSLETARNKGSKVSRTQEVIDGLHSQITILTNRQKQEIAELKEHYQQLIDSKNQTISSLQAEVERLAKELEIKNTQIETSNQLATQAQKLTAQAQQLHYLDSPTDGSKIVQKSSEDEKKQKKKHWFDWINK